VQHIDRHRCAIVQCAGKERRDGPTQGGRGKQDRMRAEMRRKRGDGAKGEEGSE
jgi:hypothetical protein